MFYPLHRRHLFKLAAAVTVSLPCRAAWAGQEHVRHVLDLMHELIALSEASANSPELRARLVRVLAARADVRAISMFALGSWRSELPQRLREEYMRLTVEYTARNFEIYVTQFPGASVRLKDMAEDNGVITVTVTLTYASGKQSDVRFRFIKPGALLVKDVNVQGIWLSLRLRDQFASVLNRNKGDFTALLGFLKDGTA